SGATKLPSCAPRPSQPWTSKITGPLPQDQAASLFPRHSTPKESALFINSSSRCGRLCRRGVKKRADAHFAPRSGESRPTVLNPIRSRVDLRSVDRTFVLLLGNSLLSCRTFVLFSFRAKTMVRFCSDIFQLSL